MADFRPVAKVWELPLGGVRKVVLDGQEIALYNVGGGYYATSNVCPHQGGPLDEGELEGDQIICPWHGWMFRVTDGAFVMNPNMKLPVFEVRVEGDDILVRAA